MITIIIGTIAGIILALMIGIGYMRSTQEYAQEIMKKLGSYNNDIN
jgi:uncharacterized membrane protein (DUF106 family)